MDPIALLAQAGERTTKVIEQVGPAQLHDPSPCTDWDVHGVINHLVGENLMFATLLAGKSLPDLSGGMPDFVGDDPAASYRTSLDTAIAAWREPGALDTMLDLPAGTMPSAFALGLHFMDTLVHGWDIAKGTGQDTSLDDGLATACLDIVHGFLSQGRPPVFGPEVPIDATASAGDRLVGLLGRTP